MNCRRADKKLSRHRPPGRFLKEPPVLPGVRRLDAALPFFARVVKSVDWDAIKKPTRERGQGRGQGLENQGSEPEVEKFGLKISG